MAPKRNGPSPAWLHPFPDLGRPRNTRNFSYLLNARERRKALLVGLSEKARQKRIVVLDSLAFPAIKTKSFVAMLKRLPVAEKKTLIVQATPDAVVTKSARNIPHVTTIAANSLNLVDVLRHDFLLVPLPSLEKMNALVPHSSTHHHGTS